MSEQDTVPKNWRWVKLREVCEVFSGSSAPQDSKYFKDGKYPFIRVSDLGKYGRTDNLEDNRDYINDIAIKELGLNKAEKGTILFPKSGAAITTNNRAILGKDAFIVSHLAALKTKKGITDPYFTYYWLCVIDMVEYLENPGYPSLKLSTISKILMPLPPIDEQCRIAAKIQALMQEIEKAKEACEKQLEASQTLPSAYLRAVFESDAAKKWERKRFDECINKRKWLKIKGIPQKNYKKEGKFAIVDQGQSLICGYTDDKASIYQGNLPVIIFGDHTRLFKYVNFPFAIGADGTKIISPNTDLLIPKFFYLSLVSLNIKSLGYSRHYKLLRNISIPVPDLKTQRKVVTELEKKISEIETLQSTIHNQQSTIDALPEAILRKAFRGEL